MAEIDKTMTMVGTPFFVAPEVIRGDHYSTSADIFSYGITLLCLAIKGKYKLSKYLKTAFQDAKKKKMAIMKFPNSADTDVSSPSWISGVMLASSCRTETTCENEVSDNRVAHHLVNKKWRPLSIGSDLEMPAAMASLVEICWADDPDARPDCNEILEFLTTDAMKEIMGKTDHGTDRRTSTVGLAVRSRVMQAQMEKDKRLSMLKAGQMSNAIADGLSGR